MTDETPAKPGKPMTPKPQSRNRRSWTAKSLYRALDDFVDRQADLTHTSPIEEVFEKLRDTIVKEALDE